MKKLDLRSGVGHPPFHPSRTRGGQRGGEGEEERRKRGITSPGPHFHEHLHEIASDLEETMPPTGEEVRLLREKIYPSGVRRLECLTGQARRLGLREIIEREQRAMPTISALSPNRNKEVSQ